MTVDIERLRRRLREFDFVRLLVDELGWNHCSEKPLTIPLDATRHSLNAVAEKCGLVVYSCSPDSDGNIPLYPIRRKIERQVAKSHFEHMIIFTDAAKTTQVWQWVRRQAGKPAACREHVFRANQTGEALVQKLQGIAFELEEEEDLRIVEVAAKVQKALDVEKVTKKFYDRFKREHETFLGFVKGIRDQADREWYASLMLNRMMFVYFIQKRGFLDDDHDYLRNRLQMIQARGGRDRFLRFYRLFLLRLFHEGLGQPEARRSPDLTALLGKVPYLNGGLFDVHELERDSPDIQIPDEAFGRIFDFFDAYTWHLDERPLRADNEINPDVLGYIFEKYVNQKQMGAYYTKEDITGYISRNTVIPFLFEAARKECPVAFGPDGGVWRLLKDDPDRYFYPAVRKGTDLDLPKEIVAGLNDVSKREGWNRPAPAEYALPTETWREHVARRKRYQEVRAKIAAGEVTSINDLVTYNLDICKFAEDVIVQSEGSELVKAFWHAIEKLSVLDPTCGSGAFLFAALNVLEPLYTACMEGMQGFLDDLERSGRKHHPDKLKPFRDVLDQVTRHPNRRYFILKSIVVGNLYGVDIMEEAVEICKLRLFLKLVAQVENVDQIEPLPDIDFNIRAGNTLVGFASLNDVKKSMEGDWVKLESLPQIEENAEIADRAFQMFRRMQTQYGMNAQEFADAKTELRHRLDVLRAELDRYLADDYGVSRHGAAVLEKWRASHQPFHWFVEFYRIMCTGGFDVIIGNPPYVEYKDVKATYAIKGYESLPCGDLYAFVLERAYGLLRETGLVGMIVPISIFGTDGFLPLQRLSSRQLTTIWASFFANRPSQLFDGAQKRLTIAIGRRGHSESPMFHTTTYIRWRKEERASLFEARLQQERRTATMQVFPASLEKLGSSVEVSTFTKLIRERQTLEMCVREPTKHNVYYTRKFGYFLAFLNFIPRITDMASGEKRLPSELKSIGFESTDQVMAAVAILSSSCFFWFWNALSDCRNVNRRDLLAFPLDFNKVGGEVRRKLCRLGERYVNELRKTVRMMTKSGLRMETFDYACCKPAIDEIDRVLAKQYGLTDEELDLIINYDIKYRLGQEGGEEAEE
jgi:hypothetical protein